MTVHELLGNLGIEYMEIEHKAVYTIEEAMAEDIPSRIEGTECKNLFLKDGKGRWFLVVIRAERRADLKAIAKKAGVQKLSFASSEALKEILGLEAGAVTPLGIINDSENRVTLLFDPSLVGERVLVHPETNTRTVSMFFSDLLKYVEALGHSYLFIDGEDGK